MRESPAPTACFGIIKLPAPTIALQVHAQPDDNFIIGTYGNKFTHPATLRAWLGQLNRFFLSLCLLAHLSHSSAFATLFPLRLRVR